MAIDVDVAYIIEGSLFKSLQSRHLRRYQEWLANRSPYVLRKGAYSPATLERKTTIIKALFTFLDKVGYIQESIHKGLRIASVRKDDRPNRDLGPADVSLLNTFRENQYRIISLALLYAETTYLENHWITRRPLSVS